MLYGISPLYILMMIVVLVISGGAQLMVKGAYSKYRKIRASKGITGAEAAARMLQHAGITGVTITRSPGGDLSDHYDPRDRTIRLSQDIYSGQSLASLGVACHEAGHAIQHAKHYAPLVLRNGIVPIANIGPQIGIILIMIGLFTLGASPAIGQTIGILGLLLFSFNFLFQLVNLVPEFDASRRANKELLAMGLIDKGPEAAGVKRMLNAAALTYVAGTLAALITLLYYAHIFLGRRN